jgi:glutathione S-transferase
VAIAGASEMIMRLYYARTPNPRKACAVAKHVGADVELVHIDLRRGEQKAPAFVAQNPNAKVPVLVDGDAILWESNAIMAHLAVRAESDLWPRAPADQVEVLRWLMWDSQHFMRYAGALFVENFIKPEFGIGEPSAAAIAEATPMFHRFASVLEDHLSTRTYLVRERLTIADFGVASILPFAEVSKLPLEPFPHIRRWHDRLLELPAWRAPFPD